MLLNFWLTLEIFEDQNARGVVLKTQEILNESIDTKRSR